MSAVAPILQDAPSLAGLPGRQAPADAGEDAAAGFGAELAQFAEAAPAPASPDAATRLAAPSVKKADFLALSLPREAVSTPDGAEAMAPSVPEVFPPEVFLAAAPPDPSPARDEAAPTLATNARPKSPGPDNDAASIERLAAVIDAAPATKAPVATATAAPPSRPLWPARSSRAEAPAANEVTARVSERTAASSRPKEEAAAPVSIAAAPAAPMPPVDPAPAIPVLLPPQAMAVAATDAAAGAAEADPVMRIGAALATTAARNTPGAKTEAAPPADDFALATPAEAVAVAVHVVAQKTWLPPVAAAFSSGLARPAPADRAAPAAAQGVADSPTPPDAGAVETKARPAFVQPETPVGLPPQDGVFASRDEAPPAAKPAPVSTQPLEKPAPAAPRRDLEVTLAPKELGGLELRMKSAGDRLELAFVADRGETARMISDGGATLTTQLHEAGIGLGGIDISAAPAAPGGGSAGATSGGSSSAQATDDGAREEPAPQGREFSGRERRDQRNEPIEQAADARARGERGFYL